jgi:hypothetical protein
VAGPVSGSKKAARTRGLLPAGGSVGRFRRRSDRILRETRKGQATRVGGHVRFSLPASSVAGLIVLAPAAPRNAILGHACQGSIASQLIRPVLLERIQPG